MKQVLLFPTRKKMCYIERTSVAGRVEDRGPIRHFCGMKFPDLARKLITDVQDSRQVVAVTDVVVLCIKK